MQHSNQNVEITDVEMSRFVTVIRNMLSTNHDKIVVYITMNILYFLQPQVTNYI